MIKIDLKSVYLQKIVVNYFLQIVNIVMPFLTIPHIILSIGIHEYGKVILAQTYVVFFGVIVNFGFENYGVVKVAQVKHNKTELSAVLSAITIIRLFVLIIAFVIYFLIFRSVLKTQIEFDLALLSFCTLIEAVLVPIWLYVGLGAFRKLLYVYMFSKIISTLLIFVLIRPGIDITYIPIIYFIGSLVACIISIYFISYCFVIRLRRVSRKYLFDYVRNCQAYLWSNLAITTYRYGLVLVLGIVSEVRFVNFFIVSDKFFKIFQSGLSPLNEVLFSRYAQVGEIGSFKTLYHDNKKKIYYLLTVISVYCLFLALAAKKILFIFNIFENEIIRNLRIMTIAVFFGFCNYILGIIILNSTGFKIYFMKSVMIVVLLSALILICLGSTYEDLGASITVVLSEFFLFLFLINRVLKESTRISSFHD